MLMRFLMLRFLWFDYCIYLYAETQILDFFSFLLELFAYSGHRKRYDQFRFGGLKLERLGRCAIYPGLIPAVAEGSQMI
jgi:hypothetical protein